VYVVQSDQRLASVAVMDKGTSGGFPVGPMFYLIID
jgi:hypothetical protein